MAKTMNKFTYLKRIFQAYIFRQHSHLDFWHGNLTGEVNENAASEPGSEFWQVFDYKANYPGPFDENGVIILDYRGTVGRQKYHIAIAQYGLACYNRYKRTGDRIWYERFMAQVKWHEENLLINEQGISLWYAYFDWEYHGIMKAPWPSGLAQGNGLSLLVRAYTETGEEKYRDMCDRVFTSMITEVKHGGVLINENDKYFWIEESLVEPPTHILNGFMWSVMGVYDYYLLTERPEVKTWFDRFINTIAHNLNTFDTGYWSLYEHAHTRIPMLASQFYHKLHIVQLEILYNISGNAQLKTVMRRWLHYQYNPLNRLLSTTIKAFFKIIYF